MHSTRAIFFSFLSLMIKDGSVEPYPVSWFSRQPVDLSFFGSGSMSMALPGSKRVGCQEVKRCQSKQDA